MKKDDRVDAPSQGLDFHRVPERNSDARHAEVAAFESWQRQRQPGPAPSLVVMRGSDDRVPPF
jgi:hypothetical protein